MVSKRLIRVLILIPLRRLPTLLTRCNYWLWTTACI